MPAAGLAVRNCGMNLPGPRASARNPADRSVPGVAALACGADAGKISVVVADLPQRSGTYCSDCYPSPEGRRWAVMRTSPLFHAGVEVTAKGRRGRQNRASATVHFDLSGGLPFGCATYCTYGNKGRVSCSEHSNDIPKQFLQCWPLRRLRPAAIRSANRPSLAAGPARPARLCWMAISWPGPRSEPLATSPIAKASPSVANNLGLCTGLTARQAAFGDIHQKTIRAAGRGWSFSFMDPAARDAAWTTQARHKGTSPCSRKS